MIKYDHLGKYDLNFEPGPELDITVYFKKYS